MGFGHRCTRASPGHGQPEPLPTESHRQPRQYMQWLAYRAERSKLSDGGHEAHRLQPRRPAAVRCSALGGMSIISITTITELLAHPEETRLGAGKRVGHHNVNGPDFSAVAGRGLPV